IIIAAPGIGNSGMTCNAIVESLDLYPTLIDLCGLKPEGTLSGVSLKPLLVDPESKWKNIAFNQFARPYEAAIGGNKPVSHMGYSVRTDKWRYTAWYNVHTGSFEYPELYSLQGSAILYENVAENPKYADIESSLNYLVQEYEAGNY
ncbi:unnamed protein product, partial [marine sediment metagenome]